MAFLLSTRNTTDGIGDFFWSTLNLNEGAVNGPIDLSLTPGESAILYLYYSADVPSNREIIRGYSINVATSQDGIVQFTEAVTLNYPSFNAGHRWISPALEMQKAWWLVRLRRWKAIISLV